MTSDFVMGPAATPDKHATVAGADARVKVTALGSDGHVTDDVPHLDRVLMSELGTLNHHLGKYILRYFEADAGQVEPVTVADERALADTLATAADAIRARAERRQRQGEVAANGIEGV